jgi:hypothetical protein
MKNMLMTVLSTSCLMLGSSLALADESASSRSPDMNQLEALLGSLGNAPAPQCAQANGVDICNANIPCCNQSDVCVTSEADPEAGFCD